MKIINHSGADAGGGYCAEVASRNERILIDFGWPPGTPDMAALQAFKGKPTRELIRAGMLPDTKGLYRDTPLGFSAALLSDSRAEQCGFLSYVNPALQVYSHALTAKLAFAAALFGETEPVEAHISTRDPGRPFPLGKFIVKPFEAADPASGAYSYLVIDKNTDKRLFYSGDISAHLSSPAMFKSLLSYKWRVDCLLLDGGVPAAGADTCHSEAAVRAGMEKACGGRKGYVFLACASQNLPRLLSAYAAARVCGRTLVIDPYTAFVLHLQEELPGNRLRFDLEGIKILFARSTYTRKVTKFTGLEDKMRRCRVTKEEIAAEPDKYILKDSWHMRQTFAEPAKNDSEKPVLIYSLGEAHLARNRKFWDNHGIEIIQLHSGGHACKEELRQLVAAMKPRVIVPAHAAQQELFKQFFPGLNVRSLGKGEELNLAAGS
ncbi:MAG TPA: hypothetical protein PKI19_01520 [Elusimicrobiales bacterium]|nr:hypothetical protein [Elusimicrobiales bacterium]